MESTIDLNPERAPVRFGVIGTGHRMAVVLKNLRAQIPQSVITAVCDTDPEALADFRRQLAPGAAVCATAGDLHAREDVDWVFIGSWNCHHAAHAISALQAGKHVFCEKPLALSHEEAAAMYAAWRAGGRTFVYGLVLRYSPLYRKARSLLDEGRIGRIISFEFNETLAFNHGGYIHGNWRRHRHLAGTHLLEKCCHDLDIAIWFAGDLPVRVASFGGCTFFRSENAAHESRIGPSPKGEPAYRAFQGVPGISPFNDDKSIVDHQVCILEFAHGVRAAFHTQCSAAIPERRFYLLGTEGTMRLDAYTGRIELRRIGWDEPMIFYEPVTGNAHAGGDGPMARELAETITGQRPARTGFVEAMRSLTAALAIDEALDEGTVVDLRPRWAEVAETFDDPLAAATAGAPLPEGPAPAPSAPARSAEEVARGEAREA